MNAPAEKPARRRWRKALALLAFIGGALLLTILVAVPFGLIKTFQIKKLMAMKMTPPPTTVTTAKVRVNLPVPRP